MKPLWATALVTSVNDSGGLRSLSALLDSPTPDFIGATGEEVNKIQIVVPEKYTMEKQCGKICTWPSTRLNSNMEIVREILGSSHRLLYTSTIIRI